MKLFLITYDLKQPGRNYSDLYDAIKSLAGEGNWKHPLESTWFVRVDDNFRVQTISSHLRTVMDVRDSLFVVDVTDRQYSGWLLRSFWEWIKN